MTKDIDLLSRDVVEEFISLMAKEHIDKAHFTV